MDIGTGIAIAGVWIFVGMCGMSSTITNAGFWISIFSACVVTIFLA